MSEIERTSILNNFIQWVNCPIQGYISKMVVAWKICNAASIKYFIEHFWGFFIGDKVLLVHVLKLSVFKQPPYA